MKYYIVESWIEACERTYNPVLKSKVHGEYPTALIALDNIEDADNNILILEISDSGINFFRRINGKTVPVTIHPPRNARDDDD